METVTTTPATTDPAIPPPVAEPETKPNGETTSFSAVIHQYPDHVELEQRRRWEKRLRKQRSVVYSAQSEVDSLSEQLKGAKKLLDEETTKLLGIIDEAEQPPLFTEPEAVASDAETAEDSDNFATWKERRRVASNALQAEFDAATLGQIGIRDTLKNKLEADGIRTGKDLQQWFAEHPPRKIPGIGEGMRDKINGLMADWFERKQNPPAKVKLADGRNSLVTGADVDGGGDDDPVKTMREDHADRIMGADDPADLVPLKEAMKPPKAKARRHQGNRKLKK